ncbi:MAG: hypothetical protein HLUCCA05_02475 [Roseibaca calidilacus]|uniref:Flagellar FliJ protein n=1 Tax=Roseibaca calidilacus TaxID=1666912 RepID=A0A0P7WND3_9RHOB|nr:hypothetical protein [Roseibaca calidilacus]KPP95542.1 MAG: hypothetical protein HLUCCA05_02475 [Roseibaca calidilacus]CUX82120.1 hypothetical protein Ga0058931_2178 [Roseibaca calidilacus]
MRSRLFHLQAQRVFVRMAQSAHWIQAAQHQAQQAQAAQDRLAVLLDSLRPASGPVSVAQLRDTARLSHSLGVEQARQAELAQTASDQAHAARGELQHQLRRHQHAQQAARRAHREEAEAAQDRHDAAVPYRAR